MCVCVCICNIMKNLINSEQYVYANISDNRLTHDMS